MSGVHRVRPARRRRRTDVGGGRGRGGRGVARAGDSNRQHRAEVKGVNPLLVERFQEGQIIARDALLEINRQGEGLLGGAATVAYYLINDTEGQIPSVNPAFGEWSSLNRFSAG